MKPTACGPGGWQRRLAAPMLGAAVIGLGACGRQDAQPAAAPTSPALVAATAATPDTIARGRALALLGNCAGCHSEPGGVAYAGGAPLATPFGITHGGNLTPDGATGLGAWSADEFWRALHFGRGRDGRALVPAFPYTAFTHVTREDSDALFAYLRSLAPVRRADRPQALDFPYGTQAALRAWQWLFFEPADLAAEAAERARLPPSQARGAYLVQGLGHCAACHAPRNAFGAPGERASGAVMAPQPWYAPSLHPSTGPTLGRAEIVALLEAGQTARAAAVGPMASVVYRSTQHWSDADRQAVADHLLALTPEPAPARGEAAAPETMARGAQLYEKHCADCHGARGEGVAGVYVALAGNPSLVQPDVRNLVQLLDHGGFSPSTAAVPRPYSMPATRLSAADAAALLTFLRQSWGHRAAAVSEVEVFKLR